MANFLLLRSNNNNRNRVESIQTAVATDGSPLTGTEENELVTVQRVRSLFPTSEESRRRRYRSQYDLNGYTDGIPLESELRTGPSVIEGMLTGVEVEALNGQQLATQEALEAIAVGIDQPIIDINKAERGIQTQESVSSQNKITEEETNKTVGPVEAIDAIKAVSTVGAGGITSPKPTKAEIENEFNNINPMTQSEGERYEERIVQLQSAPLPCIDAATGLVHIVGRMLHNCFSSAYMHGQPLLNSATYNGMQSKPRIVL